MSVGMYYDQSSVPVTVQAVSLVGAHNMVLHGATRVNARLVQPVPGAVIAAGTGPVTDFSKQQPNVYEVAVDVTARQPGAAWAAGVDVGYTANGRAYVIRLLTGVAIGAQLHPGGTKGDDPICGTAMKAIQSAFAGGLPGG